MKSDWYIDIKKHGGEYQRRVTLPESYNWNVATYYFKLRVRAGTTIRWIDMSLEVKCTDNTNIIEETHIYINGLENVQYVQPTKESNFFVLPNYQFRSIECAQLDRIELRKGSDTNSSYLHMETRAVADGSNWIIKPLNITWSAVTYKFKVRVIDTRGSTLDTTEYALVVNEPYDVFTPPVTNT